jgi:aspartyl-tRNA(Asn)/glutamyl-tRNA(Gln) amidotransferase subunit A
VPHTTSTTLQDLRAVLVSGKITPRAAAEQALSRANTNVNRNVFLALGLERVFREADTLPAKFRDAQKPLLYGLPIALKDCFDLGGFVTTCASRFYAARNGVAREDSAVAARLHSQGAVIVGKTHLHQLAYGITGENPDYGDCVQPRNAKWFTGGSSSGSAASVQEGSAIAAIGTDTGGSVRVPAALCGLAGYRASIDLAHQRGLWRGGLHLAPSFDTLGWLFRDLADAPLLSEALFGVRVPATVEMRARIGSVDADFLHDCEPEVLASFSRWQQRLRDAGAEITPMDTSFWKEALDIFAPLQAHEAAAIHTANTGGDFSHFEAPIAERLRWGASLPSQEVAKLRQRHAAFRDRMDALLGGYDFLVLPCSPLRQLLAGADHSKTRSTILRYTTPMSLAGTPVVTLPSEDGAGIQLVAARGADARLLAYAAQLSAKPATVTD